MAQPGLSPRLVARLAVGACVLSAAPLLLSPGPEAHAAAPVAPPESGYRVVNTYPHDPQAYTQGLVYRDGFLYESTGLNGRSTLRKVRLETGEIVMQQRVGARHFAEGLTDWNEQLLQLTWQSNIGFVYDRATFRLRRTFAYTGEGWGLTHDRARLILSDGTDTLRLLDPRTFLEVGRLAVKSGIEPVHNLNELEFVRGEIYANVWHSDRIARIDPRTGRVAGWVNLEGLLPQIYQRDPEAVLNGIAYDATRDRLFVTGKLWPKLFEIKVVRRGSAWKRTRR